MSVETLPIQVADLGHDRAGRYHVCPMMSAHALHKAWPESELIVVPDAGHSAFEPGNSRALVATTDRYARG